MRQEERRKGERVLKGVMKKKSGGYTYEYERVKKLSFYVLRKKVSGAKCFHSVGRLMIAALTLSNILPIFFIHHRRLSSPRPSFLLMFHFFSHSHLMSLI